MGSLGMRLAGTCKIQIHEIERAKFKISWKSPYSCMKVSFSDFDHLYLAHALNKPCSSTGSMRIINNMRLITRVYGISPSTIQNMWEKAE